jgi:hypothetical protein
MEKFDISSIKLASTVLVLNNNKDNDNSSLIVDLFYNKKDIATGIVFSKENCYNEFIQDSLIHTEYKLEIVKSLMNKQSKERIRQVQNSSSFIVIDNVNFIQREQTIKQIFYNGRCYNIFAIFSYNENLYLVPELRCNLDYIFINKEMNDLEKIYKMYGQVISSYDEFKTIIEQLHTNEYLVINNYKCTNKIFRYKPEEHDNFRLCDPRIWNILEKFVDKSILR